MSKIKIAIKYPNSLNKVTASYEVQIEKEGEYSYVNKLDYSIEATKAGTTNDRLVNSRLLPWCVKEFDLSKIRRKNAKNGSKVTVVEFLETLAKANKTRLAEGAIKVIVSEDIHEDVSKAVRDGHIKHPSNVVSEKVLEKRQINIIPDLVYDFKDEEVSGMKDLKDKVKKVDDKKSKETEKDLEVILIHCKGFSMILR